LSTLKTKAKKTSEHRTNREALDKKVPSSKPKKDV
jgi:hypothetical protein